MKPNFSLPGLFNPSHSSSRLVKKGNARHLYRTPSGALYWLDPEKYLDASIISHGVFEPESTAVVSRLVNPGDVVLDIGANFGYYTVLLSKLTGPSGHVYAFEPTSHYLKLLTANLQANHLENVTVFPLGLSDKPGTASISLGQCSATLHWTEEQPSARRETITLENLDRLISKKLPLKRLDFIKVDIDGHEPAFLRGAEKTIDRFNPAILLEVSHENYLQAGITAWDFYDYLVDNRFNLYWENKLQPIATKKDFLRICGNFTHSANIIIKKTPLY